MKFKNHIIIYSIILIILINISFAKKNKNNDIKPPQIYELEINDHYPYYIEFTLVGQFSNDKTGLSLYWNDEKIEYYSFIKGQVRVENVTVDPSASASASASSDSSSKSIPPTQTPVVTTPDKSTTPPPSLSPNNNNNKTNDNSESGTATPSPSLTPSNTPKDKKDSKKSKDSDDNKSKKNTNKKLKTSHLIQKKNDKPSKPSNNNSASLESSKEVNTQSPNVTPTPSITTTVLPKDNSTSSSSKESNTQSPNVTPTPSPTILVQDNDRVSFNITNFSSSFKPVNISIRYKSNMEVSITFTFESIITSITRVNVTGGIVDIKGRFIYDSSNSNSPQVSIGSSTCEPISFNSSLIRCYLPRGSGCQNQVSIKNIQLFNSTKYQYCYSNPIIERVIISSSSSNDKLITIIGQNFNKAPHVYLERSSKKYVQTKECSNIVYGDTIIICLLNSTYSFVQEKQQPNVKLLQEDKDQDEIHYSLFVLNVDQNNITVQQAKQLLYYNSIVGEYDLNKQHQNSTISVLEFNQDKVEKDNNKSNNNSNSKSEDTKFYLLIIIPSVLFIVIVVLIAAFVKTRAKGKDKIPFLVLNDIGSGGNGIGSGHNNNNNNNNDQFNENLITPI